MNAPVLASEVSRPWIPGGTFWVCPIYVSSRLMLAPIMNFFALRRFSAHLRNSDSQDRAVVRSCCSGQVPNGPRATPRQSSIGNQRRGASNVIATRRASAYHAADSGSRTHVGLITYDAKDPDTKFPPIEQLRPPKGAPNVLIILIDDVGFGASSAFGGPCRTPNAENLAADGLKYNRFHTTALCSPTRQALLTGRNHHSVGMGGITEIATGSPGYCSVLPNTLSPIARTLKLNGYATAQFGKCHEVPVWQTSPAGPFDAWPTGGGGFEYFYGFIGGEAHQWYPSLYEGTTPIEVKKTPEEGYHFMEDMTDKAIDWIGQQKALIPDKPFFIYFAPGATHAPHHVPKEWADKYKGQFDEGWDKLREETFARQKKLGVIPEDCQLTERHKEIPAWDDDAGGAQAGAAPPDGSLRGLPGVHRPPCRPPARHV